jgi:hypothetical protein
MTEKDSFRVKDYHNFIKITYLSLSFLRKQESNFVIPDTCFHRYDKSIQEI